MRRRVAYSRDTLQADRLKPTENMELNYRPELAPSWNVAATLGLELGIIGSLTLLVLLALTWVAPSQEWKALSSWAMPLLLLVSFWPLLLADIDLSDLGNRFRWTFMAVAALVLLALAQITTLGTLYFVVFGQALAVAVTVALLIAKQATHWMAVHPRVDWRECRQWRYIWTKLFTGAIPAECPEILSVRLALIVVVVQFGLGYIVLFHRTSSVATAVNAHAAGWQALAVVFLPLPFYWLAWHRIGVVPRMSMMTSIRATLQALHMWFAYLPVSQLPPGVFLLPTRWLRPGWVRETLFAVAVGSLAVGVFLISQVTIHATTPPRSLSFETAFSVIGLVKALALTVLLPPLLMLLLVWFVVGSLLARYWLALEAPGAYSQSEKSAWAIAVNRILNSRDVLERKHILLGRSLFGDYPVLLHRDLLNQHAHLVGDSGSRKTSLGIAPTVAQLIASNDASVVVIDLKGDRALFETTRLEAEAAGAEFRWFTTDLNHSSHVFNPLEQSHFERFSPSQKTQQILEALALDYGDAYGRGFFSAVNEIVLLNFLRRFHVRNFIELHRILTDPRVYALNGHEDDFKNARHLSALVDRLASIPNLNVTRQDLLDRPAVSAAAIDMTQLLARPQVVYFNLRSSSDPIISPAIAKFVMYSLFSAAAQRLPEQTVRVYVVIDEFQQVVSENIPLVLEQARASQVAFLIAHQSLQQLDRKGVDIRDTVSACTAFKQFFRASDPKTIKHLEELSGEGVFESLTWAQTINPRLGVDHDQSFSPLEAELGRVQVEETIGPRLERNTIIDISATPNTSFVIATEGSGFTQFSGYVTPIVTDYHITEKQYDERSKATWPPPDGGTVVFDRPHDLPPIIDTTLLGKLDSAATKRNTSEGSSHFSTSPEYPQHPH